MIGCMGPRMMELTAKFGDMWNTAYMGNSDTFIEPLNNFKQACEKQGRDPATIEITATIALQYPDLGQPVPLGENPLGGSVSEIADAFSAYEEMGVSHLMIHCTPYNQSAFERLVLSLDAYKKSVG